MNWLVTSIVLSVVLTIVLNAGVRMFPRATERTARRFDDWTRPPLDDEGPRVRVFFPWRAMLLASIVLTVVLNMGRCATR